jgi:hypothetical protein
VLAFLLLALSVIILCVGFLIAWSFLDVHFINHTFLSLKKKMAKRSEGERFSFIYSLFFFLSLFVSKYKQRERITFEDLCRKTSQRKDV